MSLVHRLKTAVVERRLSFAVARRIGKFNWSKLFNGVGEVRGSPPVITVRGDANGDLARVLNIAFSRANMGDSKLSPEIRAIPGMSGQKYRPTINNLIERLDGPRYLEVGSWAGSTAASAIFGNSGKFLCIDNWSLFGGPKEQFFKNIDLAGGKSVDFEFIESDFRQIDYLSIANFNVYMFDGPHEYIDQYDGIILAQRALDSEYILIVDDWNWEIVRLATLRALNKLKSRIVFQIEVRTTLDGSHPDLAFENSDWHNGYFIAVIQK